MSPLLFSTMLAVALTLSGATDLFSASPLQTATAPGWISPNLLLVLNQDQFLWKLEAIQRRPQAEMGRIHR